MSLDCTVGGEGYRTFQTLLLHFTGELVGLLHIALILEAVRVAAAGAEELRPAVAAAFLAVNVYLGEICLDVVVECSIV